MLLAYRRVTWVTNAVILSLAPLRKLKRVCISECGDITLTAAHLAAINAPTLQSFQARQCAWEKVCLAHVCWI